MTAKQTIDREVITPSQAREYLERNEGNRTLQEKRIATLATAIRNGEWAENGETIKFNGNGRLLDGQHRLAAIALSGRRVPCWVARGLPASAQETIDTGKSRSVADMLQLRGYKNSNELAAIARGVWIYRQAGNLQPSSNTFAQPSPQALLKMVEDEPALTERTRWATAFRKADPSLGIPARIAGTFYHVAAEVAAEEDADAFFAELLSPSSASSPTGVLRSRLLRQGTTDKLSPLMVSALLVKGWNAWMSGERPKRIVWRAGGASKEDFPMIVGRCE